MLVNGCIEASERIRLKERGSVRKVTREIACPQSIGLHLWAVGRQEEGRREGGRLLVSCFVTVGRLAG